MANNDNNAADECERLRVMMDRRAVRRAFATAFRTHGIDHADGGWLVSHPELTWTVSLVVDGSGRNAPHRLVLGASLHELGREVPTSAENCYLSLPLYWSGGDVRPPGLVTSEAMFPEWRGTDDERRQAVKSCVDALVEYTRQVSTLEHLRKRYEAGDYDGAFIILPMRALLERRT